MSVRSSTNPNQPTAEDERRMQEIVANPEIRNILLDPKVMKLIESLKFNPDEGTRYEKRGMFSRLHSLAIVIACTKYDSLLYIPAYKYSSSINRLHFSSFNLLLLTPL